MKKIIFVLSLLIGCFAVGCKTNVEPEVVTKEVYVTDWDIEAVTVVPQQLKYVEDFAWIDAKNSTYGTKAIKVDVDMMKLTVWPESTDIEKELLENGGQLLYKSSRGDDIDYFDVGCKDKVKEALRNNQWKKEFFESGKYNIYLDGNETVWLAATIKEVEKEKKEWEEKKYKPFTEIEVYNGKCYVCGIDRNGNECGTYYIWISDEKQLNLKDYPGMEEVVLEYAQGLLDNEKYDKEKYSIFGNKIILTEWEPPV